MYLSYRKDRGFRFTKKQYHRDMRLDIFLFIIITRTTIFKDIRNLGEDFFFTGEELK